MKPSESVITGLWALAEESSNSNPALSIKCLESILQSNLSLLPLTEILTRLKLSHLLLTHTHNLTHAKSHLERAHLLLSRIPSSLPLKLRAHSLLSQCYHLTGAIPPQKHTLLKALKLLEGSEGFVDGVDLWSANFNAQLASAMAIEGDYEGALGMIKEGMEAAERVEMVELRMFFAASALHVQLMYWEDGGVVEAAARRCAEIWDSVGPEKVMQLIRILT